MEDMRLELHLSAQPPRLWTHSFGKSGGNYARAQNDPAGDRPGSYVIQVIDFPSENGADERIRTVDPNLGNVRRSINLPDFLAFSMPTP
jgi:hypothetical protein